MTTVVGYQAGVPVQLELSTVECNGRTVLLEHDTAWAYQAMAAAALKDGIKLLANSGFRSIDDQTRLYDEWARGKRKCRPAKPGYSQHQSGVAIDINRSHDDPDGSGPLVGLTDRWLEEHAHIYGFYRTVPGEPWHWEHKGVVA